MNFANDRHALYAGWVLGSLMKQHHIVTPQFAVRPVTDDKGDYVPIVRFAANDPAQSFELIIPEPPEDWVLT